MSQLAKGSVQLTTAQAIVPWMAQQFIEIGGEEVRVFGGGFGIFGHGNVTCLGEALYNHREELPLYRGQNEQGMGFAAAAYAKYHLRQRIMFCTASAGPGTANLLTASATIDINDGVGVYIEPASGGLRCAATRFLRGCRTLCCNSWNFMATRRWA